MKIATVLRTGGDFDLEYVERIAASVPQNYEFICLSDDPRVPGYIPLKFTYPNWWAKMELFRPGIINDDIFYLDLDTVVVDNIAEDLAHLEQCDHMVMLSDFYTPEKIASGVMYIPEYMRTEIWTLWVVNNPKWIMETYRGDQEFLRELDQQYLRFENVLDKDWVCSYKAHISKSYPPHLKPKDVDPSRSKLVCFHGKPRPRDKGWLDHAI